MDQELITALKSLPRVGFFIVAFTAAILVGCAQEPDINWAGEDPHLIEKARNSYDKGRLIKALQRIKAWHERSAPEVAESLKPGLDEKVILERFQRLGLEPPRELVELYKWRNGCESASNIPFIWYHDFMSLNSAVSEYKTLLNDWKDLGWRAPWFPVFQFQGEFYFIPCQGPGQEATPVRFFFIEETETKPVYVNLTVMMETMAEVFESGAVWLDKPWGALKDDIERIREIHGRHNPGLIFPYF